MKLNLKNKNNIFKIVILVLTFIVFGVGLYVVIRIQQGGTEAPTTSNAALAPWCTGDCTLGARGECPGNFNLNCGSNGRGGSQVGCSNNGGMCIDPSSSGGGNTGGGNNNTSQNKNVGDQCTIGQDNPATGGCDGSGPLFCYTCPSGTQFNGQGRCARSVNNAADAIALCGGNNTPSVCEQGPSVHCGDGVQNCGETTIDHGGNCPAENAPGGTDPGKCLTGTSSASCNGRDYNTVLQTGTNSSCTCVKQGPGLCACIINGEPGGTAGLGEACNTSSDCAYSGNYKLSCISCANGRKACGNPNLAIGACESPAQSDPVAACGGALEYSVNCAGCPSGSGRVCRQGGWGSCVRADACGYTGGDRCDPTNTNNGGCPVAFNCTFGTNGYTCTPKDNTGTGSQFVGCGNVVTGGNGNRCDNCYSFNGQVNCIREKTSCGASSECLALADNPPETPPETPPSTPTVPYCGDALCASGEACERTSAGSNTFASCQSADGQAPTGSSVAACYGVELNQPDTTSTCQYCGDGVFTPGREQCDASAPAGNGNNPSQCNANCTLQQTVNQCVDLVENGVDPVKSGTGNYIMYTLVYKNSSTTNPYPAIKLRVGTSGSPVGRDAFNTASSLVAPIPGSQGYSYDSVNSTHTYKFRWEAATTGGSPVADGNYEVRVLLDGSTEVSSPVACTENLQVQSTAEAQPLFSIVKAGNPVCVSDGSVQINYTLTLTNIGPVSGVADFVRDTLDSSVVSANISPTNINPSMGSYSNGIITWTGTTEERTFAAGQSKQYSYRITIPSNLVASFSAAGVLNQALVQFDTATTTDNTDSFDVRTEVSCTGGSTTIPDTGLFDDGRFLLIGIVMAIGGATVIKVRSTRKITRPLSSK